MKLLVGLFAISAASAWADGPVVVSAEANQGAGGWRFDVAISHGDTGWDHYADGWGVYLPDGTELGYRVLHHPHVDEQPFTRSLSRRADPGWCFVGSDPPQGQSWCPGGGFRSVAGLTSAKHRPFIKPIGSHGSDDQRAGNGDDPAVPAALPEPEADKQKTDGNHRKLPELNADVEAQKRGDELRVGKRRRPAGHRQSQARAEGQIRRRSTAAMT